MQQSVTIRRMSVRTAIAVVLAVVGMLALGGAWSSATASDHGANQEGPYDPDNVCEGDNQGNGNAPCNGDVGNADDKNPPGQQPGGNDNNKGYECDGNKGVGNDGGNPAHSGCDDDTNTNTGGCVGACSSGGGTTTTTTTTTVVEEGEQPEAEAEVLGLTDQQPGAPAAPAAAAAAAAPAATQLAFTGVTADVLGFLGIALVAFGAAFMLVARRNEKSLFGTATKA